MQRVAIIIDSHQRLKRGPDIIELNFLGMQRSGAGLNVVPQLLRPLVGVMLRLQGDGPEPPCHASDYRILRIETVATEEGQIVSKSIDVESAGQIIFNVR